ncbi:MAG: DinB family protein [Sphingobacteriales bacterium]
MDIIPMLLKEMEQEAQTTRKMLERIPEDKYDWQPHAKSMTVGRLATHVAELPGWVKMTFNTDELDFAKGDYKPVVINNNKELLDYFEKCYAEGYNRLAEATEDELLLKWTLRNGDQIYSVRTKAEVVRMSFCQTVHHRAQLGVFLRLLDVPIPGSYGPSADETVFN